MGFFNDRINDRELIKKWEKEMEEAINKKMKETGINNDQYRKRALEYWKKSSELYKNGRYKCAHCGKWCLESQITVDHIVPQKNGGVGIIGNLQPLCKSCNSSKRDSMTDVLVDIEKTARINSEIEKSTKKLEKGFNKYLKKEKKGRF